jgi:peroxiredoxin
MDRVGDFALLDHEGKHHQLYRYVNSRAVVLFVYGSDCNIARDRIPALKQLRDQFATPDYGFLMNLRERFANRSVSFLMIDANPQDDRKTLQKDVARYGVDLPILKDKTQLVAESLDIYRTGEALLIDARTFSGAPRARSRLSSA